ncbi:hypothetical protein J4474_00470 [Candidatus Pacearchaeota archaeon]|nr:hypothetical protein [Candidatus Pacearchaeota archaeon]
MRKKVIKKNFFNTKKVSYDSVLVYTNQIKSRRDLAFSIYDRISIGETKLSSISENTKQILENSRQAFYLDRYAESEELLTQFETAYEKERVEASTLSGLKKGALNFFQRYWIYIILVLIVLIVLVIILYKKISRRLLIKRIAKMKAQREALNSLMKKSQEERFKENKISGLVYNIRMKKYKEKLNEIEEELPVLESKIKKINSKK